MKEFSSRHLARTATFIMTAIAVTMIIGSQFSIAQAQCVINQSALNAKSYQWLRLPKQHYKGAREIKAFEAELAVSVALHQRSVGGALTEKQQSLLIRYDAENGLNGVSLFEAKMHHRQEVARAAAAEAAAKGFQPNLLVAPANDTVAGAQVIPPAGPFPFLTTTVDITDATLTGDPAVPSCAFGGGPVFRGVWYKFTPPNSNRYTFSTCADQGTATTVDDTTLAIYTSTGGDAGPFTEIATTGNQDGCDDDSCTSEQFQSVLTTALNSGTQYYIVVFNLEPTITAGNGNLQIKVSDLGPVTPPANDTCAGAVAIPNSSFPVLTTPVNVADAGTAGDPPTPSCQASVSRSVWYTFTAPTTQKYTISSCQSDAPGSTLPDTVVAVYTSTGACAGPFTQRAGGCDDDTCTVLGLQALTTTRLEAGTQYYIVVWKFGTTAPTAGSDSVQLSISQTERNEGPGVYFSDSSVFLKNATTPGAGDFTFTFGASSVSNYRAISGDWNGDGIDTIGLYNPATAEFFLAGSNASGSSGVVQFQFGASGLGYIPLAGDWDNDGRDTIGLYDQATGTFFLRNTNTPGPADITFQFGAGGLGYIPIAGDYNNDGTDTVGIYQPTGGVFMLTNTNAAGPASIVFGYGPGGVDFKPVVGDWNGDGTDTIGVVAVSGASNGAWFLRNSNSAGNADITPFTFGSGGGQPIAGDWN